MEAIRLTFAAIDQRIALSLLTNQILARYDNNPNQLLDTVIKATPKEFSGFCQDVIACAQKRDQMALELMQRAGDEIAKVIATLINKQQGGSPLPLALAGGLSGPIYPYLPDQYKSLIVERQGNALDGAEHYLQNILNQEN